MLQGLRNIYKGLVIFCIALFQIPAFGKFDELTDNKNSEDEFNSVIGRTAVVTESVTITSGQVRFSGSNWRARLADGDGKDCIAVGQKVTIESSEGNILLVSLCATNTMQKDMSA